MSDLISTFYLGSCWVNTSRDTRLDTRYDTGHKIRTRTKESRSIDRAETENQNWRKGVSTEVELNPDVWGPGLLLNQFQDHLLKKDQFVDRSLHHLPIPKNQDQFVTVCSLRTDQPGFFSQYFQVR